VNAQIDSFVITTAAESPPILLGVLLPEVVEAGIVEKRFVGGGDIDENTEEKIMPKKNQQNEVPVKPKKREKS